MKRLLLALVALVAALATTSEAVAETTLDTSLGEGVYAGALTTGPDGNVWFSGRDVRVRKHQVVGYVTPDGAVTEYKAPGGYRSIAAGADGNLWFAERERIGKITPGGKISGFELPSGAGRPVAVTAGPDGNVWFVTNKPGAVGRVTPDGSVTTFPVTGGGQPSAITVGPADDLWFTEPRAGRIGTITTAGEERHFALPDGAEPDSIALGGDGNLWFGDGSEPRVGRITPAGETTFFAVPTIEATDEVISGPDERIWFTAGREIGNLGTDGDVSWPSCFLYPCGVEVEAMTTGPDGRLWVASSGCLEFCAGNLGGELESGGIGRYTLPTPAFAIGPRLARPSQGRTALLLDCGSAAACGGTLRLRALVKVGKAPKAARLISTVPYSLAAGTFEEVDVPFSSKLWKSLRGNKGFLIVDATENNARVGKRGFYFSLKEGGTAKPGQLVTLPS